MARRVFWIRPARHSPKAAQERAAREWGAEIVMCDGEGRESWAELMRSRRIVTEGDEIGMTRLSRIGTTRAAIGRGLADVAAKKAVIVETDTGRRSDNPADVAQMVIDAVDDLSREAQGLPSRKARANANARWKDQQERRASEDEARRVWHDIVRYPRVADVVGALPGWSKPSLYRRFGARGTSVATGTGRPRSK